MFWDSLLKYGVPLLNGVLGGKSASAQQQGAQAGLDFTKSVYGDAQANFQPYLNAGTNSLGQLGAVDAGKYEGFMNSPEYLWTVQQGTHNLDNSAAAHLNLNSGGYQKDLGKYLEGLATQNLGNYQNRLMDLARLGQGSASGLASFGNQNAQLQNQGYGNVADAKSSGYGNLAGTASSLASLFTPGGGQASSYAPAPVASPTLYTPSAPQYQYSYGG